MITCPNCHAENPEGAVYCRSCSAVLISEKPASQNPQPSNQSSATKRLEPEMRTNTKPLQAPQVFSKRPDGAIFGDAFLYKSLVYSDEKQHNYLVTQITQTQQERIHFCTNPECGAYYPASGPDSEKFCIDCGAALTVDIPDMLLVETSHPYPKNLTEVVKKALSHGSVRAPLAIFEENVAGMLRYCLVMPYVAAIVENPESSAILQWGIQLAYGLNYIHANGISFEGYIDSGSFGSVDGKLVWANFNRAVIHPTVGEEERKSDTRALAGQLFLWLTGKSHYEPDPNLSQSLNAVFEQAMSPQGFYSPVGFAQAIIGAMGETVPPPEDLDFRLGRRTHVGMVRSLNEDSLLTVEMSRICRSQGRPLGLYVVADGMGGHAAGEIASKAIVDVMAKEAATSLLPQHNNDAMDRASWLDMAVRRANQTVFEMRKDAGTDMGSTLVAAVVEGNRATISHVGDSRAYVLNAQGIQRLTTDHSLVERLVETNQITPEEARVHPQRNVIYRTIGDKLQVEVETSFHTLSQDDSLLLCSDGLSGMVEDAEIHRIVMSSNSPQEACDRLIEAANNAGGEDNITAIIVKLVKS